MSIFSVNAIHTIDLYLKTPRYVVDAVEKGCNLVRLNIRPDVENNV